MPNFIQDIVETPHPVYVKYVNYWNFLLDSYEGGVDYTAAHIPRESKSAENVNDIQVNVNGQQLEIHDSLNLFKHPKEKGTDYNRRVLRSYYYNFCAPIIDIYTDHLFRNPINEDFKNIEDIIEKRRENMDRKGSSMIELRKEKAELAQIYGHHFSIVDMPKGRGEITFADRIVNDKFPFISLLSPQNLINWSLDSFGRPFWVVLREIADGVENPEDFDKNKDNKAIINYRVLTRTSWSLYNSSFEQIDAGEHRLGVVPIVTTYNKQSKKQRGFLGVSEIADIAFIARDVYNLSSELSQIFSDQTFSFLAVQGTVEDYMGDQSLGTGKGLIYPENSQVPQYVAPPTGPAEKLMEQIDRQINKMFQLAKLEGGSAHQEQQIKSQSGISKAFDFHQTNSALSKKASNLNDAELKEMELFARWEGKGSFEGSIDYPDDFSVSELNDDIEEAFSTIKLNIGNLALIEQNKAILKKKFPRMPEDELQVIVDDMINTVNSKPSENGNGNGGRLRDRLGLTRFTSGNPAAGEQ